MNTFQLTIHEGVEQLDPVYQMREHKGSIMIPPIQFHLIRLRVRNCTSRIVHSEITTGAIVQGRLIRQWYSSSYTTPPA